MKISVIVPTFNRAQLLPKALDSALAQSFQVHELIIVDDGSTDETEDVIYEYMSQNKGLVKGITQENAGKAAALNSALQRVSGTHVLILDDDDLLLTDSLKTHYELLVEDEDSLKFTYGPSIIFRNEQEIDQKLKEWDHLSWGAEDDKLFIWAMESFRFHQASMLVPLKVYEKIGHFNEQATRNEDYEMILRLCRSFEGIAAQSPVLAYREHEGVRGPSWERHDAKDIFAVWRHYDGVLLRRLRDSLPLTEFLGKTAAHNRVEISGALERRALIQRAAIMSRRALFQECMADLRAASQVVGSERLPLSDEEIKLLGSALGQARYATLPPGTLTFFAQALVPYWKLGGRGAARTLLQRTYWSFRERLASKQYADAAGFLALMLIICGRLSYRWPFARS